MHAAIRMKLSIKTGAKPVSGALTQVTNQKRHVPLAGGIVYAKHRIDRINNVLQAHRDCLLFQGDGVSVCGAGTG